MARRILSFYFLSFALLSVHASQLTWQQRAVSHFQVYKKAGVHAFITQIEKDLGEKLIVSDKQYLTTVLSRVFSKEPPTFPTVEEIAGDLVFSTGDVTAKVAVKETKDGLLLSLNGEPLQVSNQNIEELSRLVWASLSKKYQLGPYPEFSKSRSVLHDALNLIFPKAEAGIGTVATVLIVAAVIGSLIYFTKKTTKATTKAIGQVGDSASGAVDRVGRSVANGVDRVSGSAASAIDRNSDAAEDVLRKHD